MYLYMFKNNENQIVLKYNAEERNDNESVPSSDPEQK